MKKPITVLISTLTIIGVVLIIYFYNDIDHSISGLLDKSVENETDLSSINKAVPTAAPEEIQAKGSTVISDLTDSGEGKREYTLNNIEIFDSIEDTKIAESEFNLSETLSTEIADGSILLISFNVKNLNSEKIEPLAGERFSFLLDLIPMENPDDIYKMPEERGYGGVLIYFSEHPKTDNPQLDKSDYFKFNLNPQETMDFTIGLALPKENISKQRAVLKVGYSMEDASCFDLFGG